MPNLKVLILLLSLSSSVATATVGNCVVRSGAMVLPLVELYTSEGCSSCPPADAWLTTARRDDGINWVAFHVDYWDALGWRDRFADVRYSERQRDRVAAAGENTVYTPQVMSGPNLRVDWRSAKSFEKAVAAQRQQRAPTMIEMRYDVTSRKLDVTATRVAHADLVDPVLWVAEIESGLSTQVRAGENARRELHHDAVVRALHGPFSIKAKDVAVSTRITLAADRPAQVVSWVEDARHVPRQSLALLGAGCN